MEVSGLDPLPGLCVAHLAACNNVTLNAIRINRGIHKTEVKTQNGSPKDAAEGWDRKRIANGQQTTNGYQKDSIRRTNLLERNTIRFLSHYCTMRALFVSTLKALHLLSQDLSFDPMNHRTSLLID